MPARSRTGMLMALSVAGLLVACSSGASPSATPTAETSSTNVPIATVDATATPTPTAEHTPPATGRRGEGPEPTPFVRITAFTMDVRVGDEALLTVRVPVGVLCAPTVWYRPDGGVSPRDEELKLPAKMSDAAGTATWVWTVEPVRPAVMADVELLCGDRGSSGVAFVTFLISEGPSDTPVPTMPAEFAGTWIMEPNPAQGYPGDGWAIAFFITGGCTLGQECGSFYRQESACRYPLVLSGVRPGWVGLDVGDAAPEDHCGPSGFGNGQTLARNGDSTLSWSTRDGWSETLHPFEGRLDG
jgi:hypothetical protein